VVSRSSSGVSLFQGLFPAGTLPAASLLKSAGKFAGVDVSYAVPVAWGHSQVLLYLSDILKACVYFTVEAYPAFVKNKSAFFFLY